AISLYRQLLRAGGEFSNYNFRQYALRVAREDFRKGAAVTEPRAAQKLYESGLEQLAMLRRQATMSRLFPLKKHAMEE
ncbi:MAG: hypothetical protein SGPRY_014607, partial [Prymnesium sp.]